MHKKTMLTALIALGFVMPIIVNSEISAAEINKNTQPAAELIQKMNDKQQDLPKLTEKQLKVQDSDIDTWMPNPTVRELLLGMLIKGNYLPVGSTVNEITKDLLGSVRNQETFYFEINAFKGGQITPNVSEGLQYFNPKAKVGLALVDANEAQIMQVNFAQLHQNVSQWGVYIINPEKIANPQIARKVIDEKLPIKTDNARNMPTIQYMRANYSDSKSSVSPVLTESINISDTLSPTINLSSNDFWKENDPSLFTRHAMAGTLRNSDNLKRVGFFFSFRETSEGNFLGSLPEEIANSNIMKEVAQDPQDYYTEFRFNNIYDDGQHQDIHLSSEIYANFHK
ncbi:hypothetical protein [Pediococcus acidilactici]|uniref:hypothetical protein n=2 Tax=Pediococcus acidilactici TaxID=1254 RepID=UPI001D0024E9|nr:hypothetical protein [Pediococcus acidilactici]MCB5723527.1 hypothetical protein [Pediococcus acidilactici]MCB5730210.1 hypothetical protein [Pediococcus acidilactici]MCB5732038.1 hypothetical protein [Pediococcus acidilactici]MCB5764958.1 hypothetical protein [Pediococcus acidilactici]MCB5773980.1 hypothetical protein [Pediococcus acidilactici]